METKHHFNLSRFWLLLKLEFHRSKRNVGITHLITFGLLFLGLFVENIFGDGYDERSHVGNYCMALVLGGFVVSSMAFQDLAHGMRRNSYLTLPASILEKFLSMWVLTCVLWLATLIVCYVPYTLLVAQLSDTIFGGRLQLLLHPFSDELLKSIRGYFILQGIFLIGAIQFRGYAFAKTSLVVLLFMAVCGIIFYWIMKDMIPFDEACVSRVVTFESTMLYKLWIVLGWLYCWVFAPMCWWVAYLSLKEQEG